MYFRKKEGITLIALVITIIIMLILVSVVVTLVIGEGGLLSNARKGSFKTRVAVLQEDLTQKVTEANLKAKGELDLSTVYASEMAGNMRDWIPSIEDEDISKFFVEDAKLKANRSNLTDQEIIYLQEMGIEVGSDTTQINTTDNWELDTTKSKIISYIGEKREDKTYIIPNRIRDNISGVIYKVKEVGDGTNKIFPLTNFIITRLTISSGIEKINKNVISPSNLYGTIIIEDNITFAEEFICWGTDHVRQVKIGNNVTFEEKTFDYCEDLTDVKIGNNVTFKKEALSICRSLQTVTIGNNVTFLKSCFSQSKIQDFVLGDNCTVAQDNFFANSYYLQTVTTGENFSVIGRGYGSTSPLFRNCPALRTVNIASIKDIGEYGLDGCTQITTLNFVDGGTIDENAFTGCTGVTEVIFGNTNILSNNVFDECININKIIIKGATENLRTDIFPRMTNLREILVENNSKIKVGLFAYCENLETATIKKGAKINIRIFHNCTSLKTVNLEEGIIFEGTQLAGSACFLNCTSLEEITLPSTLTALGSSMFHGCTALSNITIKEGVTSVGTNAFRNCTSLLNIELPSTLTTISPLAFYGCSNLATIRINRPRVEVEQMMEGITLTGTNATIICNDDTEW